VSKQKLRKKKSAGRNQGKILLAIAVMVIAVLAWSLNSTKRTKPQTNEEKSAVESSDLTTPLEPSNLTNLLLLPAHSLSRVDIGRMNLLCAEGLPGWETEDVEKGLAKLDEMARHVDAETKRNFYKFLNNKKEFNDSEGYFRMLVMATVLQQDFGVHYNPERAQSPDTTPEPNEVFFANSKDVFLHGLVGDGRSGTCSSMPVLYVAVGRRLGYPLKLVTTKAHLFLRWDAGLESFNLDGTSKGLNIDDDNHYRRWPFPITSEEEKRGRYLLSLTPSEELAVFLSTRALTLRAAGRTNEAIFAHSHALRLSPYSYPHYALLAQFEREIGQPIIHQAMLMALSDIAIPTGPEKNHFTALRAALQPTILAGGSYEAVLCDMALLRAEIATYNQLGRLGPADTNVLRHWMPYGAELKLHPDGSIGFLLAP
jgi:hypothetical protein